MDGPALSSHPAADNIGYQLKALQQALRQAMDQTLSEIGLTTPQYAALSALEAVPSRSGAELARACFVTPQTMQDILTGLIRAGWIARTPHPNHGRILRADLTPAGEALVAQGQVRVAAVEATLLDGLSESSLKTFSRTLARCRANFVEGS